MDATLLDWLGLGLRWFHLVVAIGWIGTSFYFMWLDSAIRPPARPREGVEGEVWMVHSGGFYQVEMRRSRPGEAAPAAALVQVGGGAHLDERDRAPAPSSTT